MKMDQKDKKGIEELIDGLECPKDFLCYKSKYDALCKAKDIGMKSFLVCLEENPRECKFSIDGGDYFFCECPLRNYIAKKIVK
jgi:hypothetical protein